MTREEALKIVRENYPHFGTSEPWLDLEKALATLIPELRESEDERIRARLIEYFKGFLEGYEDCYKDGGCVKWEGLDVKSILAWLEKQKEQKTSINIDQLKSLMLQYLQEAANEKDDSDIEADTDKWARKILGYVFEQKEQKPVEYLSKDKVYAIMNKLTNLSYSNLIPFASEEYVKIHEITFDVRRLLDYPIEQKPAEWSDEDKDRYNSTIEVLQIAKANNGYNHYGRQEIIKDITWLKSLRPSWKPSEEQIDALNYAYCELFKRGDVGHNILGPFQSLIDTLIKL